MALPSISLTDFVGVLRISKSIYNNYNDIISQEYPKFVRKITSDQAYIDILDNDPLPKKYQDLFDGTSYFNDRCNKTMIHEGLRDACIYVMYFQIVRLGGAIHTATGVEKNKSGNAMNALDYQLAVKNYNTAVIKLEREIYPFIDNYSEISQKALSSVDLGGNNYTINVANTLYLSDGDDVTINGKVYSVSNVLENASFDITASNTGIDFTGYNVVYYPYDDFNMPYDLGVF